MEFDLFGEPVLTAEEKKRPQLDSQLADRLIGKREVVEGPTHTSKDGKYGKLMKWYPPRGSGKLKTMIIGLHPADVEKKQEQVLVGPTGATLNTALAQHVGIKMDDCYLTNLVKYYIPAGTNIPKQAVDTCMPYLLEEIERFNPSLILCLGTEVFNHITGYEGGIEDYRGSRIKHPDYPDKEIAAVWLPSMILNNPDVTEIWYNDLKSVFRKHNVMAETNWELQDALPTHYVKSIPELRQAVDLMLEEQTKEFAIDTEFDGDTYFDSTCFKIDISTKFRNVDLHLFEPQQGYEPIIVEATKGKYKYCKDPEVAERKLFDSKEEFEGYIADHPIRTKPIAAFIREYKWIFDGTPEEIGQELNRLFQREGVEVWGHYGRVDFKLLLRFGVNVFDKVKIDTITLALHLNESQPLGLEDICKRYLGAPNHKLPLIHWLNTHKAGKSKLPYSFVPREIIDIYAVSDTRRTYDLKAELLRELEKVEKDARQKNEPSIKEAYLKYKMGQFFGLAEMEIVGQPINLEALKVNIDWYNQQRKKKKKACIERVLAQTGWKTFNPESPAQIQTLLFDTLGITPLYSTDKPPVPWEKVMAMEPAERQKFTPSTNQETLETLALENEICAELNDTRLLATLCKSYMRKGARWGTVKAKPTAQETLELWSNLQPPTKEEIEEDEEEDDFEEEEVWTALSKDKKSKALSQVVHPNGYLYSSYFELLETHRLATKPNISAIPKGEGKYIKDIVGEAPPYEIRWLFQAPEDWVIAEADWVTGEVWLLMMLANDPEGAKQVSDPSKFDIHSAMARRMFPHIIPQDMSEIEIKKAFKKERDAAKPVTFGVPYQRGPEAIARQLNRAAANEKLDVHYSKKDGEIFINAYKENFPLAWAYLEEQMNRVKTPRYQTSPWGFRRRYPITRDRKLIGKLQREASNWQIQHGVACCMMMACNTWRELRKNNSHVPIFLVDILHDATKWLIHKSALDLAPGLISKVMGDGLVFPQNFYHENYQPLRHEIAFYNQWCGKTIEDEQIAVMQGSTKPPTQEEIEKIVPAYKHLQLMAG